MQNVLTDDLIANTRANLEPTRSPPRRHPPPSRARRHLLPDVEAERLQEKRYLYDTLYTCPELELEHDKAEEVVTALFNFWIGNPDELPEGYLDESPPKACRASSPTTSQA